jgi:beta-galactosidase GanA
MLRFVILCLLSAAAFAQDIPRLIQRDGRFALMVDGAPFLVLGGQLHNSSAWASTLPGVWPDVAAMHLNTVAAPVYWEQFEPVEGTFDYTQMDELLKEAREHNVRLVLLWFGTWKNGQMRYTPRWVKTDGVRFPRMRDPHGEPIEVLSANAATTLEADQTAFVALMRHLKQIDGDRHTVILVQVENESGAIGSVRDYSAMAEKQFEAQVPVDVTKALHKPSGTWKQVFGGDADETFQAWSVARYIEAVAKAGKAEYPLPLYANCWVSYPVHELPERQIPQPGVGYPSGGPVQAMLSLWKLETPSLDVIGPDLYSNDSDFVHTILRTYKRPDNALWIPEANSGDDYARFFFSALGMGAIGFSPFGIDRANASVPPPSSEVAPAAAGHVSFHAENFGLIAPMQRVIAKLTSKTSCRPRSKSPRSRCRC